MYVLIIHVGENLKPMQTNGDEAIARYLNAMFSRTQIVSTFMNLWIINKMHEWDGNDGKEQTIEGNPKIKNFSDAVKQLECVWNLLFKKISYICVSLLFKEEGHTDTSLLISSVVHLSYSYCI